MIGHQELTHLSTTVGIPSAFNTQASAFPLQQQQHQQQPATFGHVPYTYDERERMADALARKLPPDCISQRSGGAAGQVKYIEGWRAVELANEIFGFNGWSMSVLNNSIDFMDNIGPGPNDPRWTVGVTCTVRITLRDGSFREDVGYGIGDNFRTKGQALEKTRKEATTDALKRTLRLFGNSLGNCLHDKDFLRQVNSIPVQRKTLSTEDIYRKGSMMQRSNTQTPTGPNGNPNGFPNGPNQSPLNSPLNGPNFGPNGNPPAHGHASARSAPAAPGPFSGIYPNNTSNSASASNGAPPPNAPHTGAPGLMGPPAVPQQQAQFSGMGDASNVVRPNGPAGGGGNGSGGHWSMNGGGGAPAGNGAGRAGSAPAGNASPAAAVNMFQPPQQNQHARPPPPPAQGGMRGPPPQQQQQLGPGQMHQYNGQMQPGGQQQQQQNMADVQKRGPPQGTEMDGNQAKRMRT